jgi:hypothetical protein
MSNTQQVTFQLRRGNTTGATGWAQQNPVLAAGEPGFELDTGKLKIGTGTTAWNSLPYVSGSGITAVNVPVNSVLVSSTGTNITGTTGLQYSQSLGMTMDSIQIRSTTQQVAVGNQAGKLAQGIDTVAVGAIAGSTNQQLKATAVGSNAGSISQSEGAVAVGYGAGLQNQGIRSVAVGTSAGAIGQGAYSVGVGYKAGAGVVSAQADNSIILNASGAEVNGISGQTGSFYVAPIRADTTKTVPLFYDPTTYEIVQGTAALGGGNTVGVTGGTGIGVTFDGTTYTVFTLSGSGSTVGVTGGTGIGVTFDGTTYTVFSLSGSASTVGVTGSTGIGVTFDGTTYTVLSTIVDSNNNITIGTGGAPSALNNSVSVGYQAGSITQGMESVAIGYLTGSIAQGVQSVAIGNQAGKVNQKNASIALGNQAGLTGQGINCIAIGGLAGKSEQGDYSIAIGRNAAYSIQGHDAIAIGNQAGFTNQGAGSIAIGKSAGGNPSQPQEANTIILNASGLAVAGVSGQTGSCYVRPVRSDPAQTIPLLYNPTTYEIVQGAPGSGGGAAPGISGGTGIGVTFDGITYTVFSSGSGGGSTVGVTGSTGIGVTFDGTTYTVAFSYAQADPVYLGGGAGNQTIGGVGVIGLGDSAGAINQGPRSIAIGSFAGTNAQGGIIGSSIAIGDSAGSNLQGAFSIAIGNQAGAGSINLQADNTIILNASGGEVDGVSGQPSSFYVTPIRADPTQTIPLLYNPNTFEIVQGTAGPGGGGGGGGGTIGVTGSAGIGVIFDGTTYTVSYNYAEPDPINLGFQAGLQAINRTVSIGANTNQTVTDNALSVTIGWNAATDFQGRQNVAIGAQAGQTYQGGNSVAVGYRAGADTQGGTTGQSVAIGAGAGQLTQGGNAIAIGYLAGQYGQPDNSIILDTTASGTIGQGGAPNSCYITAIRQDITQTIPLLYNPATYEVVMGAQPSSNTSGITMCGTNFFIDAYPFPGDGGYNNAVNIPPTGYAYVDIPIPLVTNTSHVQVTTVTRGITGLNNANDWGRVLGVQSLMSSIRVWTQQPGGTIYGFPVGSTYAGFAWNVVSVGIPYAGPW